MKSVTVTPIVDLAGNEIPAVDGKGVGVAEVFMTSLMRYNAPDGSSAVIAADAARSIYKQSQDRNGEAYPLELEDEHHKVLVDAMRTNPVGYIAWVVAAATVSLNEVK